MTTIEQDSNFYHAYRDTLLSDMVQELYENVFHYTIPEECYENTRIMYERYKIKALSATD